MTKGGSTEQFIVQFREEKPFGEQTNTCIWIKNEWVHWFSEGEVATWLSFISTGDNLCCSTDVLSSQPSRILKNYLKTEITSLLVLTGHSATMWMHGVPWEEPGGKPSSPDVIWFQSFYKFVSFALLMFRKPKDDWRSVVGTSGYRDRVLHCLRPKDGEEGPPNSVQRSVASPAVTLCPVCRC